MSLWTATVDVITKISADAAKNLPSTEAGTLALQTKAFGFGATAIGTEAEAVAHEVPLAVVH